MKESTRGQARGQGPDPITRPDVIGQDPAGGSARWRNPAGRALREVALIDRALYEAVARQATPSLDRPLRRLSGMANRSVLWLAIAALLGTVGGRSGRRAAGQGLLSIAIVSAFVNLGLKSLHGRHRPDRAQSAARIDRYVRMPGSSSFPSGHAASAFAFAEAVGVELPMLAFPLEALAAAVAYSRVHAGVHYPSDAVAGGLIGAATGHLVVRATRRRRC